MSQASKRLHRGTDQSLASRPLDPVVVSCDAIQATEPQAVGATYWFDAEPVGTPYPVTIKFFAKPVGSRGRTGGQPDARTQYERIERVMPGSGRVSVTTRFDGIAPGSWEILAGPANNPYEPGIPPGWVNPRPLRLGRASSVVDSAFAPVVRAKAPGARFGAWPALVLTGVVVAIVLQAWLASRAGLAVTGTVTVSVLASVVGLVGAKVWYLALHRQRSKSMLDAVSAGMCIQGFVVAAATALTLGTLVIGSPLGAVLDATAPGLLFAMAIGRIGCLLAGCCAGRGTNSRFGIWSSDRRIGMRRVPVQILESTLAFSLGASALLADLLGRAHPGGVAAVATLAAYTGLRQVLFPLRAERRQTRYGRAFSMAVSLAMVVALIGVAASHPRPLA